MGNDDDDELVALYARLAEEDRLESEGPLSPAERRWVLEPSQLPYAVFRTLADLAPADHPAGKMFWTKGLHLVDRAIGAYERHGCQDEPPASLIEEFGEDGEVVARMWQAMPFAFAIRAVEREDGLTKHSLQLRNEAWELYRATTPASYDADDRERFRRLVTAEAKRILGRLGHEDLEDLHQSAYVLAHDKRAAILRNYTPGATPQAPLAYVASAAVRAVKDAGRTERKRRLDRGEVPERALEVAATPTSKSSDANADLSLAEFAKLRGRPESTVRKALKDAEARGLPKPSRKGGKVVLTREAVTALDAEFEAKGSRDRSAWEPLSDLAVQLGVDETRLVTVLGDAEKATKRRARKDAEGSWLVNLTLAEEILRIWSTRRHR